MMFSVLKASFSFFLSWFLWSSGITFLQLSDATEIKKKRQKRYFDSLILKGEKLFFADVGYGHTRLKIAREKILKS